MRFPTEDLASWSGGEWKGPSSPSTVAGFSNDTRRIQADELFVAIKTESRDGHDFLGQAKDAGAAAALVERFQPETDVPQLLVEDSPKALRAIAKSYRKSWDAKVVGITGSCGKTTTKELLALILGSSPQVHRTEANLNNLLGVPLTLLKADAASVRFAVVEAGISEPGEMERLAECIQPDITIITAIGPAHLEDLVDEATIAWEKGFLARGRSVGLVIVGETCVPYAASFVPGGENSELAVVSRSRGAPELWTYDFEYKSGETSLVLNCDGQHEEYRFKGFGAGLASNAALALTAARKLGISAETARERLARWAPPKMRAEWVEVGGNRIFLDCYNANPLSMRDALQTFVAVSPVERPRLFIVGSMEELGAEAASYHRKLGKEIPALNEDRIVLIGDFAGDIFSGMNDSGKEMSNTLVAKDLGEVLGQLEGFDGSVFIKGSRKHRLERALEAWSQRTAIGGGKC